jgi:hypothetical protein
MDYNYSLKTGASQQTLYTIHAEPASLGVKVFWPFSLTPIHNKLPDSNFNPFVIFVGT